MSLSANVLQIENLVKEYPEGGGVHGLSLDIAPGTSFGLLGPNGAGKSTTLKMIMGLLRPASGSVSVLGHDVLAHPEQVRRLTGYVPEHQRMYPWMTVAQIIRFVRAFYPTWDQAFCLSLLDEYGLSATKQVSELSNGMQTKLALVLALAHSPAFLVLDEPTTGLDPLVREEFLEKVRALVQARRCTVLFSSHIMSDIDQIADTIGIMNDGRLLVVEHREALLGRTRRIAVKLEIADSTGLAPQGTIFENQQDGRWHLTVHGFSDATMEELHAKNRIREATVSAPSLEDVMKAFVKGARAV